MLLTTEVEVDARGNLPELVLGLDLVEPSIALNNVVQLKHNQEGARGRLLHTHISAVVLRDLRVAAEPVHVGLRRAGQLALEDEAIAVVLLAERGLVHEARGKVLARRAHRDVVDGPERRVR